MSIRNVRWRADIFRSAHRAMGISQVMHRRARPSPQRGPFPSAEPCDLTERLRGPRELVKSPVTTSSWRRGVLIVRRGRPLTPSDAYPVSRASSRAVLTNARSAGDTCALLGK